MFQYLWKASQGERIIFCNLSLFLSNSLSAFALGGQCLNKEVSYKEQSSLAYGADWCRKEIQSATNLHGQMAEESQETLEQKDASTSRTFTDIIATCSFYDHALNLWQVALYPWLTVALNMSINYFNPRNGQSQKATKFLNVILKNVKKEIEPCESPVKEVLFAWSHQRFFFNRPKSWNMVRTTTRLIHSASESVNILSFIKQSNSKDYTRSPKI